MQIVAFRDNLHEMSNPIFLEKKKSIILLSAEFAKSMLVLMSSRPVRISVDEFFNMPHLELPVINT